MLAAEELYIPIQARIMGQAHRQQLKAHRKRCSLNDFTRVEFGLQWSHASLGEVKAADSIARLGEVTDAKYRLLFLTYSYIERFAWFALDLLPPFPRNTVLRLILGSCGPHCLIDYGVYFRYPWRIHLGERVSINRKCEFYPSLSNSLIRIESGAVLGPNVKIYAAGQDPDDPQLGDIAADVVIGPRVYLGGDSIIRYGVKINADAVVGAGAVVVNDLDAGGIYAGVPARRIALRQIDGDSPDAVSH